MYKYLISYHYFSKVMIKTIMLIESCRKWYLTPNIKRKNALVKLKKGALEVINYSNNVHAQQ